MCMCERGRKKDGGREERIEGGKEKYERCVCVCT